MLSLSRLARIAYVFAFAAAVFLLLEPAHSQAQFGVSGGYRGTPALPTIAIPIISSGSSSASGSGVGGRFGGGFGGSASGSFQTQIIHFNLSAIIPNGGRILQCPPPTMMPQLNNLLYAGILFSPFTSDTTGAPWGALTGLSAGGGIGISGMVGGIGGFSAGGVAGGVGGVAGGVAGGVGGGIAGGGGMGMGGGGMRGGMGGFAGKGMGGFNGRKPL